MKGIGSSPRARGTGARCILDERECRFIPARAGNGAGGVQGAPWKAVHPRARGERTAFRDSAASRSGSSPRARGTALIKQVEQLGLRFIPARAGNGVPGSKTCGMETVHPRARGERVSGSFFVSSIIGSSPRARGTGEALHKQRTNRRFIPARAGNGQGLGRHRRCGAVHPRARGERSCSNLATSIGKSQGRNPTDRKMKGHVCYLVVKDHHLCLLLWEET